MDCIFCKIIEKKIKTNILFENKMCLVFPPINPVTKGHVLIIPKKHYKDIFDIDEKYLVSLIDIAKTIAIDFKKDLIITGINILHASGEDAQQSIPHFHFHLVPRRHNDGLDLWFKNKL